MCWHKPEKDSIVGRERHLKKAIILTNIVAFVNSKEKEWIMLLDASKWRDSGERILTVVYARGLSCLVGLIGKEFKIGFGDLCRNLWIKHKILLKKNLFTERYHSSAPSLHADLI